MPEFETITFVTRRRSFELWRGGETSSDLPLSLHVFAQSRLALYAFAYLTASVVQPP